MCRLNSKRKTTYHEYSIYACMVNQLQTYIYTQKCLIQLQIVETQKDAEPKFGPQSTYTVHLLWNWKEHFWDSFHSLLVDTIWTLWPTWIPSLLLFRMEGSFAQKLLLASSSSSWSRSTGCPLELPFFPFFSSAYKWIPKFALPCRVAERVKSGSALFSPLFWSMQMVAQRIQGPPLCVVSYSSTTKRIHLQCVKQTYVCWFISVSAVRAVF